MRPEHLIIAPVLIPLIAGALMLFYRERQRRKKRAISLASAGALLFVAIELVQRAEGAGPSGIEVGTYLLGNWPAPAAIVLVLDRLSALMLLLTATIALATLVFASVRWDGEGQHFHSLFQFLLMGLNGAFLTGDLFNLFVFFEVLLAASYGLALHGSGARRVQAGLHYVAINLAASLLFLIGVSLIYGATGTLNMADLANQVDGLDPASRPLFQAGAAILGIAFLVKAAMWPLAFWLPATYQAAAPPVAAMFALLSKVGVYVVLRLTTLVLGPAAGWSAGFGAEFLFAGGMATIGFGMLGVLAAQGLGRVASCTVLVSSGTIIALVGLLGLGDGSGPLVAAGLYYMINSTIAIAALFLMLEILEREQGDFAGLIAVTSEAYGFGDEEPEEVPRDVGIEVPASLSLLGLCFAACTLMIAGLPPLSGFLGKFAMLSAAFNPGGLGEAAGFPTAAAAFAAILLLSGLAALVALLRLGIQAFWTTPDEEPPRVALAEIAPVIALLVLTAAMAVYAGPAMHYLDKTAASLVDPQTYIEGVLQAPRAGTAGVDAAAVPE